MGRARSDVEIVVVGQGAAAAATAWHLARAGRDVLLLPARTPGEDTPVEVTVPARTGTTGPAVDLADAAGPLWRAVEDETGACLLSPTGGLDHGATGRTAELARVLTARGHRMEWLTADEAERRWPGMRLTARCCTSPTAPAGCTPPRPPGRCGRRPSAGARPSTPGRDSPGCPDPATDSPWRPPSARSGPGGRSSWTPR